MDSRSEPYRGPFATPPPPPAAVGGSSPEDYYRSNSPDSHGYAHTTTASPASPTDSSAPFMFRMGSTGSFGQHSHSGSTNGHYQPEAFMPPPTIPEATNYRVSMGVINGEVDGGATTPRVVDNDDTQPAAAPLSAGLPKSAGYTTFSTGGIPRTPGTAKEAERVEELELKARKFDRKDLAIKLKIRLAKVVLRSINCCCSIVVLALVISTFAIFYATRHLASRDIAGAEFRPWAVDTPQWPQIVTLVVACISMILSFSIMYSYWRGGHHMAERQALRVTVIAGALFLGTVIMWAAIIGIMQTARSNSDGKDIWGWACNDNKRRALFSDSVDYVLVCRQQDWVVVCAIIEISVEFLAILVYLFAFYRIFYSKKRLRKSMSVRDEARQELWLAQLKEKGDLEAVGSDDETSKNTAYNQLNANTRVVPEKSEVPILQAVPSAAKRHGSIAAASTNGTQNSGIPPVPPPPVLPAALAELQGPRSPRVVSFAAEPKSNAA